MEAAGEMQSFAPIIVVNGVEYGDYPSAVWDNANNKDVDSVEDAEIIEEISEERECSLGPYLLTQYDIKNIFEELRELIDMDVYGDVDGQQYDLDYKMYRIEAIHHYRGHAERGGDSYCGMWETVGVIDEDSIEVVRVFDEDGIEYPNVMRKLNEYAKNRVI